MNYKTPVPAISTSASENLRELLGYIEELKAETEAKLTFMENTLHKLRSDVNGIKEANL